MLNTPQDILKKYWGYDSFRDSQLDIIQSVMNGNDILAVLPTGAGKSITYQVPTLLSDGLCIVVSPLISLIKDQNEALINRGIKSIAIAGSLHFNELDIALDNCVYGDVKFLFLSPERLNNSLVVERIKRMNVSLIAIDEAHCISEWGYDFRPKYLELYKLKELLPDTPTLALTASATPKVEEDIVEKLFLNKPKIFNSGIERHRLSYNVFDVSNKRKVLLDLLNKHSNQSGIIYAHTRRDVKELSEFISSQNHNSDFYHAGLSYDERYYKQEQWKKNKLNILVATTAFGMGIDKPDVRYVIHFDIPTSIESYYQESGRAGRDNKDSSTYLIYNDFDINNYISRVKQSIPNYDTVKRVYQGLTNTFQLPIGSGEGLSFDFNIKAFSDKYKIDLNTIYNCLNVIERQGYISTNSGFYDSSKVIIKVNHKELYNIQVANKDIDELLKTLLRSHTGLFEDFIKIDESKIAKRMNWSETKVKQLLNKLSNDNIIDYLESTNNPKIVFEQVRVDVKHLKITKEFLNNRIEQAENRMNSMVEYLRNTSTCRSIQLSAYFGITQSNKCGICDVCKHNQ